MLALNGYKPHNSHPVQEGAACPAYYHLLMPYIITGYSDSFNDIQNHVIAIKAHV
jgi:hypothetical protein